jgi:hypothetical protein
VSRRRVRRGFLLLVIAALVPPARAESDLDEDLLEKKYTHGDYGFYLGWHDPWDPQFDETAPGVYDQAYSFPMGFKMRFRWQERFFLEGDFSYARHGSDPVPFVSTVAAPEIDALTVGASFQAMLRRSGWMRPYLGAGGMFVSISRDFIVDLVPAIPELEDSPDRYQLGTWNEMDVGVQLQAGLDFRIGRRAFPFIEYRHLLGTLGIDDINIGGFTFTPDELLIPGTYDFSGPSVLAGLKIHF